MSRLARFAFTALISLTIGISVAWSQASGNAAASGSPTRGATAAQTRSPRPHRYIRPEAGRPGTQFRPGISASPPPTGAINPNFPTQLGNTVGTPGVGAIPGVGNFGNINQPGLPPGTPPAIPNINNPAGPLNRPGPPERERHRGGGGGTVIYAVPYYGGPYTPYYYDPNMGYFYYETQPGAPYAPATPPSPEQPPAAGTPPVPTGPQVWYYGGSEMPATGQSSESEQPQTPPAEPNAQAPTTPAPKPVTLLAFKDHTIVAVTDYWLEGDTLYYQTTYSGKTGIPLDRLDLPMTEQLNRERGLKFALESRP